MKYFLTFLFLLGVILVNKANETVADSLYKKGDFNMAATFYLFELKNNEISETKKVLLYLKRVNALKMSGVFDVPLNEINAYFPDIENDSLKAEIRFEAAVLALLTNDAQTSNFNLLWLENYLPNINSNKRYTLQIVTYCELNNYQKAKEVLYNSQYKIDSTLRVDLAKQIDEALLFKPKSINKANWYSIFIPGLGQAYTKNYGSGLASFLLNAGALGYMAVNFYLGNYLTCFTVGSGLLNSFYSGGRRRTETLVKKYNHDNFLKINSGIRSKILK